MRFRAGRNPLPALRGFDMALESEAGRILEILDLRSKVETAAGMINSYREEVALLAGEMDDLRDRLKAEEDLREPLSADEIGAVRLALKTLLRSRLF